MAVGAAPHERAQMADLEEKTASWETVIETAERFGVHENTIYRQLNAGTFPCRALRIGWVWRIDPNDVVRHLAGIAPFNPTT